MAEEELRQLAWLATVPGRVLVEAAERIRATEPDPVRAAAALRPLAPDAGLAAAASTQGELRGRSVGKFGDRAKLMLFTRDALEQATRWTVSEHRAERLVGAGMRTAVDLGCGLGGDLLGLATAGLEITGVELDPVRAFLAQHNLAACGLSGRVEVGDARAWPLAPYDVVFADPARRSAAGRTFRVDDWAPSWDFVSALLRRTACVKAAPGLPHDLVPDDVEAEWVSDHGEVKEAALWSGALAGVRRRASVLGPAGWSSLTDTDPVLEETGPVGAFLFEPDGAVIRAGLVTTLAALVGGRRLDPRIAYLTADGAAATPYARAYRVLEELPSHERPLRAALRARGVGRLTIKKRGLPISPDDLRRRLGLKGDREATIVLSRVGRGALCLLVEPVRNDG